MFGYEPHAHLLFSYIHTSFLPTPEAIAGNRWKKEKSVT